MPASLYKPATVNTIIEQLKNGKNLTQICDQPGMPTAGTIKGWKLRHPDFRKQYKEARQGVAYKRGKEPLDINQDVLNAMFARIAQGETVTSVCKTKGFPSYSVFNQWIVRGTATLQEQYRYARQQQANAHVERCVDIADEATKEIKGLEDPRHSSAIAKITTDRIRARQWVASRLNPNSWSDKIQLDVSSQVKVVKPDSMKKKGGKKAGTGKKAPKKTKKKP